MGALSVAVSFTYPTVYNVSTKGFFDWLTKDSSAITRRRTGGGSTITLAGDTNAFSSGLCEIDWTDGTPGASGFHTDGVYVPWDAGTPRITLTFPAGADARRAIMLLGNFCSSASNTVKITASLSDSSASTVINTDFVNTSGGIGGIATIDYTANSAGQTLTIWLEPTGTSGFDDAEFVAAGWLSFAPPDPISLPWNKSLRRGRGAANSGR